MSQNNGNSEATGFAIAAALLAFVGIFIYAVMVFIALVLSAVCFFAWDKERRIGRYTVTPLEARQFVARGMIGAFLALLFALFIDRMFGVRINPDYVLHIALAGYALGSLGVALMQAEEEEASSNLTILPPERQTLPPRKAPKTECPAEAFRFASWNDEAGR